MRDDKRLSQVGSFSRFLREQAIEQKLSQSITNPKKRDQATVCDELSKKEIGRSRFEVQSNREKISRDEPFTPSSGHVVKNDKPREKFVRNHFLLSARTKEAMKIRNQILEFRLEEEKSRLKPGR